LFVTSFIQDISFVHLKGQENTRGLKIASQL